MVRVLGEGDAVHRIVLELNSLAFNHLLEAELEGIVELKTTNELFRIANVEAGEENKKKNTLRLVGVEKQQQNLLFLIDEFSGAAEPSPLHCPTLHRQGDRNGNVWDVNLLVRTRTIFGLKFCNKKKVRERRTDIALSVGGVVFLVWSLWCKFHIALGSFSEVLLDRSASLEVVSRVLLKANWEILGALETHSPPWVVVERVVEARVGGKVHCPSVSRLADEEPRVKRGAQNELE